MKVDTLDDLLTICERIGCTLSELPKRMSPKEIRLWQARLQTHPATSPDRWYARLLSALLKGSTPADELLPHRSRIATLRMTFLERFQDMQQQSIAVFDRIRKMYKK
jgi:hypothetical protein